MFIVNTNIITLGSINWSYILGGFGLFLFGMQYMGNGLKAFAGEKLREYIEKYTKSPWQGILIGAFITLFIQSSSATTAITIGLIRSGLMRLNQAVGIIMGANIGTTMTAFLIGFKLDAYALYFVFVGALIFLFSAKKRTKYLGEIILGFGLLFFGLKIMGDELRLLNRLPEFVNLVTFMADYPSLSLIVSTIMTGILQSSSALIGVIQKLYASNALTLAVALPFLFGSNIGTTITAVFAAMGGSIAAKRAATIHVLFNVIGSLLFMFLLDPFSLLIKNLSLHFAIDPMMQLAVAHIIFNVTVTILFYPFINYIVVLVKKIIRGDEKIIETNMEELNTDLAIRLPQSALAVAKEATLKMGKLALDNLNEVKLFITTKDHACVEGIEQFESAINTYDKKITNYLILIAQQQLDNEDAHRYMTTMQVIKNLERISDICMNLKEFFEMIYETGEDLSQPATEEVNSMITMVIEMTEIGLRCYYSHDEELYHRNKELENLLDSADETNRKNHFKRMAINECHATVAGSLYIDIIASIERMGDHAQNISKHTIKNDRHVVNHD